MSTINPVSKKLGERIRSLRRKKDWSQERLALEAGLNRAYIGYIERAERNPSNETLTKIAKVLGIELYKLFKF